MKKQNSLLYAAIGGLVVVRSLYMKQLWSVFPKMSDSSILPAIALGIVLFVIVSIMNAVIIRRRINIIWNNKG